jgi:hypothetical protein
MHRHERPSPALRIYLSLNAAVFIVAGALMIAVARGGSLSTLRLILLGATFFAAALTAASAIFLYLRPRTDQALNQAVFDARLRKRLVPLFGIAFPVFWSLTWLPPAYTGDLHDYFIGFYPLFLCGTLACGSALVFLLSSRVESTGTAWMDYWRAHKTALYVALVALGAFALTALLTSALGILSGREPYWYGAGVPILASQVFLAALITVIVLHLQARPPRIRLPVDLLLFVLIWAVTAALWASRPVPESYWVTAPRPPNHENYPFSDQAVFDAASQFALIGQGINNHLFFDRGLYIAFLVYLHILGGQNFQQLMALQATLFAVFPALLYLIGKHLHSRAAGILIAALITMRGLNSLTAAAWIDTATFKHMLTDFPTAIGLAVLVLLLLKWLEAPGQNGRYLLWTGGLLGLTSLVRPHVLLLLAPLLLLAAWLYRSRWQHVLVLGTLTLVASFAAVAPWMFLSPGAGSLFALYGKRIQDVMAQRYPTSTAVPARPTFGPKATAIPATIEPGRTLAPVQPTSVPLAPPTPVPLPAEPGLPFQVTHYIHNLVTSALIFPDSPVFLSVKDAVKGGEPLWEPRWDGSLSPTAAGMLILSLIAVALGLGTAFQSLRWRGFMPLAVLLIYYVANALARTSGGRYLVPVDWIMVCYFGLGLAELLQVGGHLVGVWESASVSASIGAGAGTRPLSAVNALAILGSIVLIGGLIPVAGVLYPPRYPPKALSAVQAEIEPFLPNLGLSAADVSAFLDQPGAVALYGRALYPRFYQQGAGEPVRYLPFRQTNYPRTVFILIGPAGQPFVILPGPAPKILPNASDTVVLGCRSVQEGYDVVNALAVILPAQGGSYARSPAASLTCPFPAPVCNSNGVCR